jgi:hypothetical protein
MIACVQLVDTSEKHLGGRPTKRTPERENLLLSAIKHCTQSSLKHCKCRNSNGLLPDRVVFFQQVLKNSFSWRRISSLDRLELDALADKHLVRHLFRDGLVFAPVKSTPFLSRCWRDLRGNFKEALSYFGSHFEPLNSLISPR